LKSIPTLELINGVDAKTFLENAANPDRKAAEWVLANGGFVDIQGDQVKKSTIGPGEQLPPVPFALLYVVLEKSNTLTDAGLANLQGATKMWNLNLSFTPVGDAGLVHVKGLVKLINLNLQKTKVTDAGLVHLKDLRALKTLTLHTTKVGDAGLLHLKDLQGLNSLNLFKTNVTDAGLQHLYGLKSLNFLYLEKTKVTAEGVKKLHAALPQCTIISDHGTLKPAAPAQEAAFINLFNGKDLTGWYESTTDKNGLAGKTTTVDQHTEVKDGILAMSALFKNGKSSPKELWTVKQCNGDLHLKVEVRPSPKAEAKL
jgi:hypothetical protein